MLVLARVSSRPFATASLLDSTRLEQLVGGAPVGAVGRPESDGRRGYSSQGDRADALQHYE